MSVQAAHVSMKDNVLMDSILTHVYVDLDSVESIVQLTLMIAKQNPVETMVDCLIFLSLICIIYFCCDFEFHHS